MKAHRKNRSVSAAIGEHLVLGELLKRGAEAYLAHGETQKGWDIVLVHRGSPLRVQVKTIDWPTHKTVNGIFKKGSRVSGGRATRPSKRKKSILHLFAAGVGSLSIRAKSGPWRFKDSNDE
jgi:hypothetical protein